ncbi:hypothetical protein GCM10020358_51510 [Amorphoplanes nipponensis]|uniref:N-acetyltransferase domain-containing protein n=1 Tax=Actinoplanes nipponensis TaxID=135950 RepID=A0A919JH50_9ACTN|nr:GNAT family N-acetyltransferase [Actinoplanes nipponensis]GIE50909.1 hypothetical protein Ani05nite_44430 [Actinoplanes nipponensis]
MPALIAPTARLHAAWLEAHAEWGPGRHEDGFGLSPADDVARRRGLATWAMSRMLDEARALGMRRVLAVCAPGNAASARTIERCGGVLEGVGETGHGGAARYWIDL